MKPSQPVKDSAPPIILQFDDNSLLPSLFGEYDQNVARIEQKLAVTITSRGNRIAVTGESGQMELARATLDQLYDRLKRGLAVDLNEVDAALRFAAEAVRARLSGVDHAENGTVTLRTPKRHITARSPGQARYLRDLFANELVFALGPAGTGKTYLAVAVAVAMMISGRVDRIILSRPAVEAGERLGFLPGDLRDKIDPYLRPLYDALFDMLPADQVSRRLATGEIEVAPLAFMRGRTLANAFVILDEAQNTTPVQMKMFLTRLGENSRMAVTGDLSQVDLPPGSSHGLADALRTLQAIPGTSFVHLTDADVVRHPLVTRIVRAYDEEDRRRGRIFPGDSGGT